MNTYLVLFTRIFVDESRLVDGILSFFRRERNWTNHFGTRTLGCLDNRLRGLINNLVIVSTNLDSNASLVFLFLSLFSHKLWKKERKGGTVTRPSLNYLIILVAIPAPTVRPPSRIAKDIFSSRATGWMSFTVTFTVSPGITISVPSGRVTSPVTSVVLM